MAQGTNNSLTQFLQQLLRVQKNSMEIVGKLTEITSSSADAVVITQEDSAGLTQTYELPSIGSIRNDIDRIDANFNKLIGQDGQTITVRMADGSFKKIIQANLFNEPKQIGTLLVPSKFNKKNNWFFESFLNPLLYVSFDITNYVEYNTQQVSYMRLIVNADTDEKKLYFDNTLKNKNDINYDTLIKNLNDRGITYFIDSDVASLPASIARYSGFFDVISYSDEIVTKVQANGVNTQEKVRKYKLNTLKYTDNLQNFKSTQTLKVGDKVEVGLSTTYEITSIDTNSNTVIFKKVSGTEGIPTGTDVLKIAVSAFSIKEVQINVAFDERQVIFVKAIDRDSNLTTRDFSPGAAFYSNELVITTGSGDITLDKYYKQEVLDFGLSLMALGKEGNVPVIYGEKPDAPRVEATNLQVLQINKQKTDTEAVKTIKAKLTQKDTLKAEITQLDVSINNAKQLLNTTNFNSDTERQAVKNQLDTLTSQRVSTSNLYASIVQELSAISNNRPSELDSPMYRIRGFFPIPSAKPSARTLDQEIVQFVISYRYLRKDGTATGTDQLDFVDNNGEKVRGYFSNWNEIITKARGKVYDTNLGVYVWANENVENGDSININQIDIPITPGEQVEIRVKSISEAGWPVNPLTSDWSTSVIIPFPANLGTDQEIVTALNAAAAEETRVTFNQDLAARGVDTHIAGSFVQKDKYYPHNTDNIASGFFTSDGSIITLYNKLLEIDKELATIKATIEKAKGQLTVYVVDENGSKYKVSNNSMVDLFAGYYAEIVKTLPVESRKGAIINKRYNIIIENTSVTPLQLVSLFPGGLDTGLPVSNTSTDLDYKNSRKYDIVPLSLSGLDAINTTNENTYQASPFQSAQVLSQYMYGRATDIGLKQTVVGASGSATIEENSLYPETSGSSTFSYIWDGFAGVNGGGYASDFCIHISHPDIVNGNLTDLNEPTITTGGEAVYPAFTHANYFNLQSSDENGKIQLQYLSHDTSDTIVKNRYPAKLGFYTNDKYLIGRNTCGSYLFASPAKYGDILIDGTDYKATKELLFGQEFQISIPVLYQFRMTDYFGSGSKGLGRIGGDNGIKNITYSKKIGFDIFVKDETKFSFDIQVTSKYKADSPGQSSISPAQTQIFGQ